MYNEERKQAFINQSNRNDLPVLFTCSEPYETKWGKDLCEFSYEEMDCFLKAQKYTSTRSIVEVITSINIYIAFSIENGYISRIFTPLSTNINEIQKYIEQQWKNPKLWTREEVFCLLEEIKNSRDEFIILGLFEGLEPDEILDLRGDDFKDGFVQTPIRKIQISEELEIIAKRASRQIIMSGSQMLAPGDFCVRVLEKASESSRKFIISNVLKKYNSPHHILGIIPLKHSGFTEYVKKGAEVHNLSILELVYDRELFKPIYRRYGFARAEQGRNALVRLGII